MIQLSFPSADSSYIFLKEKLENNSTKSTISPINSKRELNEINQSLGILKKINTIYEKIPGEQSKEMQSTIQKIVKITTSIIKIVDPTSTDRKFSIINRELAIYIKALISPKTEGRSQDNAKMSDLREIMRLLRKIQGAGKPHETINWGVHNYEFASKNSDFLVKHSSAAKLRDEINKLCQIFDKNPKDYFILTLEEGPTIILRVHRNLFDNLKSSSTDYQLPVSDYPMILSELKKETAIDFGRAYDNKPRGPKIREALEAYGQEIPTSVQDAKNLCEKLEAEVQSLSYTGQLDGTIIQRLTYLYNEAVQSVSTIGKQFNDKNKEIMLRFNK